ncbi:minor capsid protein [Levilactobacillus bambusae]|nr:minor capsid protein [Levilactobacillus bambusae]
MADKNKLNYWELRAVRLEQAHHDAGDEVVEILVQAYAAAVQYLTGEADKLYERYLSKSNLTEEEVAKVLNTAITPDQLVILQQMLKETKDKKIQKQIKAYLDGLSVKSRISRIELLRTKAYVVAKRIADVQLSESTDYYIKAIQDAYLNASAESIIGNTQKEFNVYQGEAIPEVKHDVILFTNPESDEPIHKVNVTSVKPVTKLKELTTTEVKQQLETPWFGESYSERIWKNTDELAKRLQELFTVQRMTGMTDHDMEQALMKEFGVNSYKARRLIRTESSYMAHQAKLKAWQDHGVKQYSLVAVLDFRTSQFCRAHDGKVYDVKLARCAGFAGNYPPFHPFCRTVAVAYFTATKRGGYRTARDPIADETMKIPRFSTYQQWEQMLVDKHGQPEVNLMQKKVKNYTRDLKQYRGMQSDLGDENMPVSFDNYQNMKYRNDKDWKELNIYRKQRVQGTLSPLMSFEDYQKLRKLALNTLIGTKTSDGHEVKSFSQHFMERLIGPSKEVQHAKIRNGVHLSDVENALQSNRVRASSSDKTVQLYYGDKARVTLNINTGNIIQVNPSRKRGK